MKKIAALFLFIVLSTGILEGASRHRAGAYGACPSEPHKLFLSALVMKIFGAKGHEDAPPSGGEAYATEAHAETADETPAVPPLFCAMGRLAVKGVPHVPTSLLQVERGGRRVSFVPRGVATRLRRDPTRVLDALDEGGEEPEPRPSSAKRSGDFDSLDALMAQFNRGVDGKQRSISR
ncbi:hypothetical protein HN446_00565 [bacterium]|jgi:hypothetical protein|nr:hypothetical protein [bacterium]